MIEIGKAIEGISINGLEWVLDNEGQVMRFDSREDAKRFLRENGYDHLSDEELEDSFFYKDTDDDD